MKNCLKHKKIAIAVSLFCMALWGTAIPLIKSTYQELAIDASDTGAKILVAGIRFFLAGLLALFYFAVFNRTEAKKAAAEPFRINPRYILILSFLQTSVQYLFYYIGLSNTSGVKSSIIQASNAFFVVIFSVLLIRGERITLQRAAAVFLGTLGIVAVNLNAGSAAGGFHLNGEGFILIATISNVFATIYVKKYGAGQDAMLSTGLQFALGAVFLLVIGLFLCREIPHFTPLSLLMLLYGGFISATAFSLWTMVLQCQSSAEFAAYKLFIPIFGSLFSVLFLHEHFTRNLLLGMLLVLLGSYVLNLRIKTRS